MRKLAIVTFLTLDGVMQAPGGKDEGGGDIFDLGGWRKRFSRTTWLTNFG